MGIVGMTEKGRVMGELRSQDVPVQGSDAMRTGSDAEMDQSVFDALGPTIHWYPSDPRYRRSGAKNPQPGDIAHCGWVKERPTPDLLGKPLTCLPCARLKGLGS